MVQDNKLQIGELYKFKDNKLTRTDNNCLELEKDTPVFRKQLIQPNKRKLKKKTNFFQIC